MRQGMLLGLMLLLTAAAQPKPEQPKPELRFNEFPEARVVHKSTMDADKARRYFHDFARCIAKGDRLKAAAALVLPYGSEEQGKRLGKLVHGQDGCFGPISGELHIKFDPPAMAAGIAEYFILEPDGIDQIRQRNAKLFVWGEPTPLEAFGTCVVSQDIEKAKMLIRAPVASEQERSAVAALAPSLGQCIAEGQTLKLNIASVRSLLAVSLYRQVAAPRQPNAAANAQPAAPPK